MVQLNCTGYHRLLFDATNPQSFLLTVDFIFSNAASRERFPTGFRMNLNWIHAGVELRLALSRAKNAKEG
jgi:hypothetical protein